MSLPMASLVEEGPGRANRALQLDSLCDLSLVSDILHKSLRTFGTVDAISYIGSMES